MGRFEVPAVRGPAIVVDCSDWDALGEEIVYDQFVTDVVSGPAVLQPTSIPMLSVSFEVEGGGELEAALLKLVPIMELVKGCGFSWDRRPSTGEPGRIAIHFAPTTEDAIDRLPWLKATLTPVLADMREVSNPQWIDVPATKV